MYQAIVFLPLLGAIIGGIIALVGAHRRHPGAEPGPGEHAHHGHASQSASHHGHNGHDSGSHGDHDPAAEGSQAAEIVTSGFLVVAAVLSWVAFVGFWLAGAEPQRIQVFNWFTSGTFAADWALRIDTLTVVMLIVVNTVSALVHIYSIGYMAHDPNRPRSSLICRCSPSRC